MQPIKYSEIAEITGGQFICRGKNDTASGITTDSRKISEGDLFIPLVGARFDGHDFIMSSLQAGASGSLTSVDVRPVEGKTIIKVEDTLKALSAIAGHYREKFRIPFVGITGSVGKTSTKDMIACVLSRRFCVLKTEGNFNNEIGLPLTIFRLDNTHEAAVVEMGMSGLGEISRLTAVARPEVAVITNIGMSHIEKLGSRQNILKAKMEILEGLNKDGLVILNGDDNLLSGLKGLLSFRTVFYGINEGLDYQAFNVRTEGESGTFFEITIGASDYKVHVPVPGIHNVHNALAAIAAGIELGIPVNEIVKGIDDFTPGEMRLNIVKRNGLKIINDAYNASPQSMEAAMSVLSDIKGAGRSVAVLGDMLEMGDWAEKAHFGVGSLAASARLDCLVTVGKQARYIAEGAVKSGMPGEKIFSFECNRDVSQFLNEFLREGDTILIKGSRGMKMEQIVELL